MWANFHSHSEYCDGQGPLTAYADKAVELGMKSIGFSSHAPVPFECSWCMKKEKLPGYLEEIDSMKKLYPSIELYKGMEVDYIPDVVSYNDFKTVLDYGVGSIHFVDQFADGKPWEIDG